MTGQNISPITTHPRQSPSGPIMATDVAHEIKAAGAMVWLLQKPDYGFLLRCEIGLKQFRVVIPPIVAGAYPDVPHEPSPVYVVQDLTGLSEWLRAIQPILSPTN